MPTLALLGIFVASAGAIWVAGTALSRTTDSLDGRFGFGQALGGLILLGVATSLPELAITVSAAARGNLELAIGNLLGGIAIQTVVLVALDARVRGTRPLTFLSGSLVSTAEAMTVLGVTTLAVLGALLPADVSAAGLSPVSVAIALTWVGGLMVVRHMQAHPAWQTAPVDARPGRRARHHPRHEPDDRYAGRSTRWVGAAFAGAALVTLCAGVAIEESGNALAGRAGLSGAVFGATILAAATALPELSTGLSAVRAGNHQLATSDIFGGNAFMPVLFVLADLVSGTPALPTARATDLWMAGVGVMVTAIYAISAVVRPRTRRWRLGLDSRLVLAIYALGIVGLTIVH